MTHSILKLQDPLAVLRGMKPQQFREALALHSGATTAQLDTLRSFEKDVGSSFPSYEAGPDGIIRATYTSLTGAVVTATVLLDGTLMD